MSCGDILFVPAFTIWCLMLTSCAFCCITWCQLVFLYLRGNNQTPPYQTQICSCKLTQFSDYFEAILLSEHGVKCPLFQRPARFPLLFFSTVVWLMPEPVLLIGKVVDQSLDYVTWIQSYAANSRLFSRSFPVYLILFTYHLHHNMITAFYVNSKLAKYFIL